MSPPASKRIRLSPIADLADAKGLAATGQPNTTPASSEAAAKEDSADEAPADSHINSEDALKYWTSTPATVSGVLGGYPQLSKTDIQGSANFLAKLRRSSGKAASTKFSRAVDCGAGIGRITEGFLQKVAERIDVVEPAHNFCDEVRRRAKEGKIQGLGTVWEVGLENWEPHEPSSTGDNIKKGDEEDGKGALCYIQYDLIWNQWCLGQLNDKQLEHYLFRSIQYLQPDGLVVVKENLSNLPTSEDIFDETDSSVTRSKEKFETIFERAGLKVIKTELQRGFPKELYPVRIWGLRPL